MLELINNKAIPGDEIYDHYSGVQVPISKRNEANYIFGVVSYDSKNNQFFFGFFKKMPLDNIMVVIDSRKFAVAMSKDIFSDGIEYSNGLGLYIVKSDKRQPFKPTKEKGSGNFPYSIKRLYESHDHLKDFSKSPSLSPMYSEEFKSLMKYTFGLEYETVGGYIPQELCYRYGLMPLRDGSISGVEYASTVLDNSDGLEKITKHLELLNEYTYFNKECSLHIHLGGFPLDSNAIFALYVLWDIVSEELSSILPKYAFKTSLFKNSRKDYCKLNPFICNNFDDLYRLLSGGRANYSGSLTQRHPQDPERKAKWNIKERYWAQSLIGMCFYKGPKTVEYRMLPPTYNIHKVIFWLYLLNAIMIYAEHLAEKYKDYKSMLFQIYKSDPTIDDIVKTVYPATLSERMIDMMSTLEYVINAQSLSGDYIGSNIDIENEIIKRGITE